MTEREFAIDVVRRLREAGHEALWAGGCVRDQVMGREPHDYDVATDAPPERVQHLFRRTVAVGASFGVVEVIGPRVGGEHVKVQVATFRIDEDYEDERRPKAVRFCSAREDALRRDFTINGMFFDPIENKLIDYVGGQADIEAKVLRAIGDPRERFKEDKLRLLRAVRFAARFELALDPATADAIREMAGRITVVAAERIADELRKLLIDRHRVRGLQLMDEANLLAPVLPEVAALRSAPSGVSDVGAVDLWRHMLRVVARLPAEVSFPLALAAVLHNTGKARMLSRGSALPIAGYEAASRDIADAVCARLRLSNAERERVQWLVEHHLALRDAPSLRPSRLKPLLAKPGIEDLVALHRADALAAGVDLAAIEYAEERRKEWTARGDLDPPPLLTGEDLKQLGLTPGPLFKRILDAVRAAQLDGDLTTREQAMEMAKGLSTTNLN